MVFAKFMRLPVGLLLVSKSGCCSLVGQTPWSAAGPLAGFLRRSTKADEGVGRGPGGPPHLMSTPQPRLRRALGLWDLIFCGLILVQPTAPMPNFGIIGQDSKGHIATSILIAMVAMLFTAVSYGRMARAYPSAGSVFTYVVREMNPTLG